MSVEGVVSMDSFHCILAVVVLAGITAAGAGFGVLGWTYLSLVVPPAMIMVALTP